MKKKLITLLCVFTVIITLPIFAHADVGPKPKIVVDFKDLEGQNYYATLLSQETNTGPWGVADTEDSPRSEGEEDMIRWKFQKYEDFSGFHFIGYFEHSSETHTLSWTYYPPKVFKVLLYFPDTDSFISSENFYKTYAFDSYFNATVENFVVSSNSVYGKITVISSSKYFSELFFRMLFTIFIEILIAIAFGFRKKHHMLVIVLTNIVTQIALNIGLAALELPLNPGKFVIVYIVYIFFETIVFAAEAFVYSRYLREKESTSSSLKESTNYVEEKSPLSKVVLYAFIANAASFILGIIVFSFFER